MTALADAGPYAGPAGKTRTRQAVYKCRCGQRFSMDIQGSVDISSRPDLLEKLIAGGLNRAECPSCHAPVSVEARCVLHDPKWRRFILWLPESERHAELEARAELLMELARDPGPGIPDYVLGFDVAFGAGGLKEVLSAPPRAVVAAEMEKKSRELEARIADLSREKEGLRAWEEKLRLKDGDLAGRESALAARQGEIERSFQEVASLREEFLTQKLALEKRARESEEFAQALALRDKPARAAGTAPAGKPRFPAEARAEPRAEPRDEPRTDGAGSSWFTTVRPREPAAPIQSPGLQESVARATEISDSDVVEEADIVTEEAIVEERRIEAAVPVVKAPDRPAARDRAAGQPAKQGRRPGQIDGEISKALASPSRRWVGLADNKVEVWAVAADEALLEGVKNASVRFRVHLVEDQSGYPWAVLTAAIRPPRREVFLFKWLLDYQVRTHRRMLGRLGERCEAHVTLASQDLERTVTFVAANRIEGNVKSIASDLERYFLDHPRLDSPSAPDENAIVGGLLAELKKPFPFHSKYVEEHGTPHGLVKALGDVEEWSQPESSKRLVRIYSFPLEGLATIRRRVLSKAVEIGLDVPGTLPESAVAMGLADDDTALVSHSLRAFLAVQRSGHDLEAGEVAENWRRLVDAAIRRGVPVDPEVAEVAMDWLAPLGIEVPGAADIRALDSKPLAEVDTEILERWLSRPSRRAAAATELLARGGEGALEAVSSALTLMDTGDLLEVAPRIMEMEDAAEGLFMSGLKSTGREVRLASAIALGRLKLRSAIVPLLGAMCEHEEPDWKVEAMVLSRYGGTAMRTVEQFLRNPRGCEERLVFLASLLLSAGCEKQVKDLTSDADMMLSTLAKRALERRIAVQAEADALAHADTDDVLVLFARTMDARLGQAAKG